MHTKDRQRRKLAYLMASTHALWWAGRAGQRVDACLVDDLTTAILHGQSQAEQSADDQGQGTPTT